MKFGSSPVPAPRAAVTRRTAAAALALGPALLRPTAARAQTARKPPVKLTIGNATVSTPPYAAYNTSVPQEIFFPQEGLEIRIIAMAGAAVAVQAMATGKVDIALPSNSLTLSLLEKQPDTDIRGFYTFLNGFQSMPVVLKDSPIRQLNDLAGKTIGVQSLGNSQVVTTKALLTLSGADPNSLKFVAVGEGAEAAHALQTRRVDSLALFDGLYGQVEGAGVPLRVLTSDATNQDEVGFSACIVTDSKFMREQRDTVVRYGRAIAKGTLFTKTNPEAAVRIHWKHYPETRQRGLSEAQALQAGLASLNARLLNVYEVDGLFGNSSARQIEGYLKLMRTGGQLTKTQHVNNFWDPSLLKDINDFDREAVRKMAREWKA